MSFSSHGGANLCNAFTIGKFHYREEEEYCDSKEKSSSIRLNDVPSTVIKVGDNCIQNFHLGSYIVGYTVGNLVLRRRASDAVKRDF